MIIIEELKILISKFEKDIKYYKNADKYNENNCRMEFIDPFFKLLGWDISNSQGKAPQYREVITENYVADTGRPDYSMTLNGVIKYYLEAKKPAVNIEKEQSPALQVRRYGWSSNLRISVLTNFEYLIIYDTTIPPTDADDSNVAAIKKYHYTEYVDKFDEINKFLSKENVYNGTIDNTLDKYGAKGINKGLQLPVDKYFLNSINKWRLELGNYLLKNEDYTLDTINDCIQDFINQIIFLRICEDRKLPTYHKLKECLSEKNFLDELDKLFREADKKYNSGLFSGNNIIFDLDNKIIREIIEELYYPKSPYQFNLISPNILGQIYELFLAEHLILENGKLILQPKELEIHREIVTTPIEIVKYIVDETMHKVCKNKAPNEILNLKIADIACGSGIFIVEAFDYLVRYFTEWYINNDKSQLIDLGSNNYKLPIDRKKEILEGCIYGIDIDIHAVEVAKLNLLLKLLEDETEPMLSGKEKLLPELKNNILYGNSLVDLENINYKKLTEEEKKEIVPFDWSKIDKEEKIDVIIGNPPYVNTENMKKLLNSKELSVYKNKYTTSKGQYDKYFIFVERAIEKLKYDGYMCYIIPNKFAKIKAGESLRDLISKNKYICEYVDFGAKQIFKKQNKTVYSSILSLQKSSHSEFKYVEVDNLSSWFAGENEKTMKLNTNVISDLPWALVAEMEKMNLINEMYTNSVSLGQEADIFNGVQTSAEKIYRINGKDVINETPEGLIISDNGKEYKIEKDILKKYYKPMAGSERNIGTYDVYSTDKYIIFPYDSNGKLYELSTMKNEYPGTMEYLEANYDELVPKQLNTGGKRDVPLAEENTWYQYGRDQALKAFNNRPKLIGGILSKKPRYLYDNEDLVIATGGTAGYCAIAKKEGSKYELEYIQAYLTHPYTEMLLSIIGSDFEGDQYSRGTNVLNRIPFKIIDFDKKEQKDIYDEVVSNTRRIYEINEKLLKSKIAKRDLSILENEKEYLIKENEILIKKVYKLK